MCEPSQPDVPGEAPKLTPFNLQRFSDKPSEAEAEVLRTHYRELLRLGRIHLDEVAANPSLPTKRAAAEEACAIIAELQQHVGRSPETMLVLLPFAEALDELAERAQDLRHECQHDHDT